MTTINDVTAALGEVEPELRQPTQGGMASVDLADRIQAVRKILARHEEHWIGRPERYFSQWDPMMCRRTKSRRST